MNNQVIKKLISDFGVALMNMPVSQQIPAALSFIKFIQCQFDTDIELIIGGFKLDKQFTKDIEKPITNNCYEQFLKTVHKIKVYQNNKTVLVASNIGTLDMIIDSFKCLEESFIIDFILNDGTTLSSTL